MNTNLTNKQLEVINQEVKAFLSNFDYLAIMKYNGFYFVYISENDLKENRFTYNTKDLKTIKGWLYACVQCKNGVVK